MDNDILTRIKAQIEELEKRIKALSMQVTTNAYFGTLKLCLDDVKTLIIQFKEELDAHLEDCEEMDSTYTTALQEYTTAMAQYNTIAQTVQTLSSNYTTLQTTKADKSEIPSIAGLASTTYVDNAISDAIDDVEEEIDDLEADITALQTSKANVSDIPSISGLATTSYVDGEIDDLEDDLSVLETRVETLEQNQGSGGSGSGCNCEEIINFGENLLIQTATKNFVSGASFLPQIFYCDMDNEVYVEYTVYGNIVDPAINSSGFYMTIYKQNDESGELSSLSSRNTCEAINYAEQFVPMSNNFVYTIKAKFTPRRKLNAVFLYSFLYDAYNITKIDVKILGKNIDIINTEFPINIECFNNNCYITMQKNGTLKYKVDTFANVLSNVRDSILVGYSKYELKESYVDLMPSVVPANISTCYSNPCLIPAIPKTTGSATAIALDNNFTNNAKFGATCSDGCLVGARICKVENDVFSAVTEYISSSYSSTSINWLPGGLGWGGDVGVKVNADGSKITMLGNNNSNSKIYYDGGYITGMCYAMPVKNNNLEVGDTPAWHGMITMRISDQMNIFYPDRDSSYYVELGVGKNATAYYQSNGNINVYINKGTDIYKYVLAQNNGQYAISGTPTAVAKGQKLCELYNNYVLIIKSTKYEIRQLV